MENSGLTGKLVPGQFLSVGLDIRGAGGGEPDRDENLLKGSFWLCLAHFSTPEGGPVCSEFGDFWGVCVTSSWGRWGQRREELGAWCQFLQMYPGAKLPQTPTGGSKLLPPSPPPHTNSDSLWVGGKIEESRSIRVGYLHRS